MIEVRKEDFSIDRVISSLKNRKVGAIVSFLGTVRGFSENREIEKLEFQIYKEMAEKQLQKISSETARRFQVNDIAIIHRFGALRVSENILLIAVASPHRDEAFRACRHVLERLKRDVPIWKKEFTLREAYWKEGEHVKTTNSPVKMVNISEKPVVKRSATASGRIRLLRETVEAVRRREIEKGDVLATAEIASIVAAKKTWEIIPLCHQIPLSGVSLNFKIEDDNISASCRVNADYKTGVEMEALVGVTTALLTIWDMVKYLEKDERGEYPTARIEEIRVIEKRKGVV